MRFLSWTTLTAGLLVALAGLAHAQTEALAPDNLRRIAGSIVEFTREDVTRCQVKPMLDLEKVGGITGPGAVGVIVVGDAGLDRARIASADVDTPAALGMIFWRDCTLEVRERPIPLDQAWTWTQGDVTFHGAVIATRLGDIGPRFELWGPGDQPFSRTPFMKLTDVGPMAGLAPGDRDDATKRTPVKLTLGEMWTITISFTAP